MSGLPKTPALPDFDATTFCKLLVSGKPITPALQTQFVNWKRAVEGTVPYDGADKGLRDHVAAIATLVNQMKVSADGNAAFDQGLNERLTAAENEIETLKAARLPFPGSS